SRMRQASETPPYPEVSVDLALSMPAAARPASPPVRPTAFSPEEEIAHGPALWLWDYLRRSGAGGFFLPLSGGSDSASVAMIVAALCHRLAERVRREAAASGGDATEGDTPGEGETQQVTRDLRRVLGLGQDQDPPDDPRALAGRLLTTAYLPTRVSGDASRERARAVARAVGADHLEVDVQAAVDALASASGSAALDPDDAPLRFAGEGGDASDQRALENLQARTRMVTAYLLAQRAPKLRGVRGPRLVLAAANVDEALVGYVTKYDAGAADLNPIGGVAKTDLRRFLAWARDALDAPDLDAVLQAVPSAELAPADEHGEQSDEREIGLTYEELSVLGRLRAEERCGPLEAFERARLAWPERTAGEVAERVKRFYRAYALHRHKATVATPSVHLEAYAPSDRRFDLRPYLIDPAWRWAFRAIDRKLHEGEPVPENAREDADR
ncbi:MAG: NAD(+) synthase, partial [Trueperaceae bacterium]